MLILSFLATVFTSVLWLVCAGFYISARFAGTDLYALAISDVSLCAVLVFIPLLVLWVVWGYFCSLRHEQGLQRQFSLLSAQIRQSQEYSDVIARLMLKNSQLQAHAFAMGKIDLYIGEMNEILSDILRRYRFLEENGMREVWTTVRLGNRWGFAKAVVDLYNADGDFEDKLLTTAKAQPLLAGSLTEFCARYTRLLGLLKVHDEENILQDVIETGAFGRVFAIFAPVVRNLYEEKAENEKPSAPEIVPDPVVLKDEERFFKDDDEKKDENESKPSLFGNFDQEDEKKDVAVNVPEKTKKPFWSRLLGLHDDEEDISGRLDPLTIALERSFGTPDKPATGDASQNKEPKLEIAQPDNTAIEESKTDAEILPVEISDSVSEENTEIPTGNVDLEEKTEKVSSEKTVKHPVSKRFAFANTDKTIKSLQKEWEEMKKNDRAAVNVQKSEE